MNPKLIIFIHLALIGLLGLGNPVLAQKADSSALNGVNSGNLNDVGPWEIDPGLSVRLNLRDGKSIQGLISRYSRDGFLGQFGKIHWSTLDPNDRVRIFRSLLRKSGRDDQAGLEDLAVVMLAIGDAPHNAQSMNRFLARVDASKREDMELAVQEQAKDLRASWDARTSIENAERLHKGLHHIRYVNDHGSQVWKAILPLEQASTAEEVRRRLTAQISGLVLQPAQGRSIIVFGADETLALARTAVQLDDLHEKLSVILGLVDSENIFSGVAAMVVLRNSDELRIVAAELFNQNISLNSLGMVCIDSAKNVPIGQGGGALGTTEDIPVILTVEMEPSVAAIEHARLYTSAVLYRHHSSVSLPPWLEVGFIEYVANSVFPEAGINTQRRPGGLGAIRDSARLDWLLDMDADSQRMGAYGDARDASFILVTRLINENPGAFRSLVLKLKKGASLQDSWKSTYGSTLQEFLVDAQEWFRFND